MTSEEQDRNFWSFVRKSEGCWEWLGCLQNGYGHCAHRLGQQAHRVSWQLLKGPIPNGVMVLHTCDVRTCSNPAHLYLGDHGDNAKDRESRGRGNSRRSRLEHGMSKLSEEDIALIQMSELDTTDLMDLYSVSRTTINRARR